MAEITTICTKLKEALDAISGLRPSDGVPDQINYPHAWPQLMGLDYEQDFGSGSLLRFTVHLAAAPVQVGLLAGQVATWPYMQASGTKSIKAALEADKTLGGNVEYLMVTRCRDLNSYERNGIEYWGCVWDLEIYT